MHETPQRGSEVGAGGPLEFEAQNIEVKMRKTAKKGKAKMKKDKLTNVDTETYKKWISDPESVKDIVRAPRPMASTRKEGTARRYQSLASQVTCVSVSASASASVPVSVSMQMCNGNVGRHQSLASQGA